RGVPYALAGDRRARQNAPVGDGGGCGFAALGARVEPAAQRPAAVGLPVLALRAAARLTVARSRTPRALGAVLRPGERATHRTRPATPEVLVAEPQDPSRPDHPR